MPPPRRRRPVQPATRVRLPRTARPRGAPGTETPDTYVPATETPGQLATETPDTEALASDLAEAGPQTQDELPADDLITDAPDSDLAEDGPQAEDELPADDLITDAPPDSDLAEDEGPDSDLAAAKRPDSDLAAGKRPDSDLAAAEGPAGDGLAAGGTAENADAVADADAGGEVASGQRTAAGDAASGPRRRPPVLPACLGVLAVILGGLAVWFGLAAGSVSSGVDTSNVALTNPAATRQVSQQIATAVNTIFSYNYADTAKTSQAAAAVLTGRARGEYNTLFRLVRLDAPKEKLVLTTTVTNSGVEYLVGNQARVLIFANQRDTAGAARTATDAGAMFAVNAVYQGGRWKIAHIDTFGAGG